MSLVVAPYCGQNQTALIPVPARIAYQYWDGEEGPWVMLPYASLYPPPPEPPPQKYSLWNRMTLFEGSQFSSEVRNRP